MNLRWSFSTNAFRKYTLPDSLAAIARCDYAGVEIMADRPHAYPDDLSQKQRWELRRLISDLGLEVANINAFMLTAIESFHRPSWIEPDAAYRQKRIDYTLRCIELASDLGAKTLSTEPGGPMNQVKDREEACSLFRDGLEQVLPDLRSSGIKLLIEPEPDLLLATSKDYEDFIRQTDWPEIRLNLDVGHFFCVGEDPVTVIHRLCKDIEHVHLEDIPPDRRHIHTQLGHGAMDIPGILQALKDMQYAGWVTVELYPYEDTAIETARSARAYLRDMEIVNRHLEQ